MPTSALFSLSSHSPVSTYSPGNKVAHFSIKSIFLHNGRQAVSTGVSFPGLLRHTCNTPGPWYIRSTHTLLQSPTPNKHYGPSSPWVRSGLGGPLLHLSHFFKARRPDGPEGDVIEDPCLKHEHGCSPTRASLLLFFVQSKPGLLIETAEIVVRRGKEISQHVLYGERWSIRGPSVGCQR